MLRCALAAALANLAAELLGLSHSVWASMSALIVSHEKLSSTRAGVTGRIAGTVIGALVALAVHRLGAPLGINLQLALAVAVCALIASGRPTLRVCLWTCPLVLLTASPEESPEFTAMSRAVEVLLGAVIGGAMHYVEAALLRRLEAESCSPSDTHAGD
ncbi:FUSC family protein [Uliginosibacterium paludis]|uniref:FUSC family protein n=1 Tax=Uliginosibacterium paludis TaxID=1615952 RepID=A0ABV2CSQ1_9RHOO